MLFNSSEFLLFLPIVFGLYWLVVQRNLKAQNQELWLTALGLPNKSHLCPVLNPMSKSFGAVLLTLALLTTLTADAQRRRAPRDGGGQTPKTVQESIRSAEEKEAARTAELRTSWNDAKESHYKKQDKATRKRMRQNDRRRKRAAQGREIPWWRRIFGKPNRYR